MSATTQAKPSPRHLRRIHALPQAKGVWLAAGLFQFDEDNQIAYSIQYLSSHKRYGRVHWSMWYEWLEKPCPDLDPNVNRGLIRAFRVASEDDPANPEVAVWLQQDAKL